MNLFRGRPSMDAHVRDLRRDTVRRGHLIAAAVLAVFVYSPLVDNLTAQWLIRLLVVPGIAINGLVMWNLPRIRRRLLGKPRP